MFKRKRSGNLPLEASQKRMKVLEVPKNRKRKDLGDISDGKKSERSPSEARRKRFKAQEVANNNKRKDLEDTSNERPKKGARREESFESATLISDLNKHCMQHIFHFLKESDKQNFKKGLFKFVSFSYFIPHTESMT